MIIKNKKYDLTKGTVIIRDPFIVKLTSDYDEFHSWYEAVEMMTDDENLVPTENECVVTPADLVGGEIA